MFDGKVGVSRKVNTAGNKTKKSSADFIEDTRRLREQRAIERTRVKASIRIQCLFRGRITRRSTYKLYRAMFDKKILEVRNVQNILKTKNIVFMIPRETIFELMTFLLFFYSLSEDIQRILSLHSIIIDSVSKVEYNDNEQQDSLQKFNIFMNIDLSKFSIYSINSSENRILFLIKKVLLLSLHSITSSSSTLLNISLKSDLIDSSFNLFSIIASKISISNNNNEIITRTYLSVLLVVCVEFTKLLKKVLLSTEGNSELVESSKLVLLLSQIIMEVIRILNDNNQSASKSGDISVMSYYQEEIIRAICANILVIPKLQLHSSQFGLIQLISSSNNENFSWIRFLSVITSSDNRSDYNELSKISFLGNLIDNYFLKGSVQVLSNDCINRLFDKSDNNSTFMLISLFFSSWISSTNTLPLVSIANYSNNHNDNAVNDISSIDIHKNEIAQSYQMATGSKKLEYRIYYLLLYLKQKEFNKWMSMKQYWDSYNSITSIITNKNFIITVFDYFFGNESNRSEEFQIPQMQLLNIYATILQCYMTSNTKNNLESLLPAPLQSINSINLNILSTISFSFKNASIILNVWTFIINTFGNLIDVFLSLEDSCFHYNSHVLSALQSFKMVSSLLLLRNMYSIFYFFFTSLLHKMSATDDEEFLKLLSIIDIVSITQILRRLLYKLYWVEPLFDMNSDIADSVNDTLDLLQLTKYQLLSAATNLLNHIYLRNERRQFLSDAIWPWPQLSFNDLNVLDDNSLLSDTDANSPIDGAFVMKNPKIRAILTFIPHVIPFKQRVSILQSLLDHDKANYYNGNDAHGLAMMGMGGSIVRIQVRRDRLVEDAFKGLNNVGNKLKGRIQIEFISEQGYNEAGIDGGGLFKEFMDSFAKSAFDLQFGLFNSTSHQLLTPNPDSHVVGEDHLNYFYFIGKIMGKALYEKILLEAEFAGGFLNALLGRSNSIDDLYSLDEQMYRSLMQLKRFALDGGNLDDLELFFEATRNQFGAVISTDLIPNGSQIKVDKSNIHSYIHRLASYKQNVEISDQCKAFLSGFRVMIPLEWIRMFNTKELQLLISGDQRAIDIEDMKRHVVYASGYHESQPYVENLWTIISEMSPADQGLLLKFVTSCSRQPLLGFSQLNPKFCIQQIPMHSSSSSTIQDGESTEAPRLPSAATCMNLLKLPKYSSMEQLREKLLYAIRSNSGFELS